VTWAKGLPAGLAEAVLVCIAEVKQRPVNPARTGTDAKTIVALWRREGKPDPLTFRADLLAVIRWARESADKLAARDIRAEGWADGVDRHDDLSTLTRQDKWSVRLDAAKRWVDTPAPTTTTADWAEADACRAIVTRALMTGADIEPKDSHMRWMGRRVLKLMGGRDGWKHRTASPEWASQWRATWGTALADREAELRRIT